MDKQYQYWDGVPGLYEPFWWRRVGDTYEYIGKDMKRHTSKLPPEDYIYNQMPWR